MSVDTEASRERANKNIAAYEIVGLRKEVARLRQAAVEWKEHPDRLWAKEDTKWKPLLAAAGPMLGAFNVSEKERFRKAVAACWERK